MTACEIAVHDVTCSIYIDMLLHYILYSMTLHIIYYIIYYIIEEKILYSRCDIIVKTLLGTPHIHDVGIEQVFFDIIGTLTFLVPPKSMTYLGI
jgi:hypothetical protein